MPELTPDDFDLPQHVLAVVLLGLGDLSSTTEAAVFANLTPGELEALLEDADVTASAMAQAPAVDASVPLALFRAQRGLNAALTELHRRLKEEPDLLTVPELAKVGVLSERLAGIAEARASVLKRQRIREEQVLPLITTEVVETDGTDRFTLTMTAPMALCLNYRDTGTPSLERPI